MNMKGEVKLIFFGMPCHVFGKRHSLPANVMNTEYSVFISVFKKEKSSGKIRRHSLPEVSFLFWVHDNSGKYKNNQDSSSLFLSTIFCQSLNCSMCKPYLHTNRRAWSHIAWSIYRQEKMYQPFCLLNILIRHTIVNIII